MDLEYGMHVELNIRNRIQKKLYLKKLLSSCCMKRDKHCHLIAT